MQSLAQVNEELTGKLEKNLVSLKVQSAVAKSKTILI